MNIIKFKVGDVLELKKKHPCGENHFKVLRVGGEMRLSCIGCGHDLIIDRIKLEKATKKVTSSQESKENENVG